MSKYRPTMKDVAKLAGVTQPTVSYVINGSANISDEVKARVHAAIRELNYRPNYTARALKTNRSNIIGILIPDIVNQYYSRLVDLVQTELYEKNHQITIYSTSYNEKIEENSIRQLLSSNVYGIIVMYQLANTTCWNLLKESGKPVVAIEGGSHCASLNIPCINVDSHLGGYMATRYLLGRGAKRIAYIQQKTIIEALEDRCEGYKAAMKEAGLFNEKNIFTTDSPGNKWIEGKLLGQQLAEFPIDAILTTSDIIAVGIIRQLRMNHKRVPDDVAVLGYDNVPIAELFIPSLTTMAQPLEDMSALAVQTILTLSDDMPLPIIPALQPKLVIRESA